ncbi:aldose 1-epimerase family protein [Acidomonas methanolica]|nr:aldose 1-epimerase family protein [Acidomonas methanolica]MBU2653546.1 aldose 1-epimerase family protein [Acidomonas methanolica]
MTVDTHSFGDSSLSATVAAKGAELERLHVEGPDGRPLLWNAGPAWPRHAPVLFPIVGRLPEDRAELDGAPVHLTQHGFARDRVFRWLERTETGCMLELADDAETRALFPRAFSLRIRYTIENGALSVRYIVRNPDAERTLPASLGAHPAFCWPQQPGASREGHRLVFSREETGPLRRVTGGLLDPALFPNPVEGRTLVLADALFEADALIFAPVASGGVRFLDQSGRGIEVSWDGFPDLGVWTKPGAGFLCIEPWHGTAAPEGFDGNFATKSGLFHLPPGGSFHAGWTVRPV